MHKDVTRNIGESSIKIREYETFTATTYYPPGFFIDSSSGKEPIVKTHRLLAEGYEKQSQK